MAVAGVTGSDALVGVESVGQSVEAGFDVLGFENDMRAVFFGDSASTVPQTRRLVESDPEFRAFDVDVRDADAISRLFETNRGRIELVLHAAAQPSHDWAASDPRGDFAINANCTLNLLEAIELCERISGNQLDCELGEDARIGDHGWWISDPGEFRAGYTEWGVTDDVEAVLREVFEANVEQWTATPE